MIEYRNIGKVFSEGTHAVDDFSLTIDSRTTTVLVGSSGCGKTTLLRMVNRMVDPTHGQIQIDDVDISTRNPVELRRSIGYVMQHAGLLPHRTVRDNIAAPLVLDGMKRRQAREHAEQMLPTVGLDVEVATKYPIQLSGGQQQRVGVARGLVTDPNIMLMDEPFGAVDPIVREELQGELMRLQRDLGTTVVFVTHDIDEAFILGDQIVILRTGGHIAQVGSPAEILADPADDFVSTFVGLDRGKRRLTISERNGSQVVLDSEGRAAGVLD